MGDWHPECPERLVAIDDQMIASGLAALVEHCEAPLADPADVERVHGARYLAELQAHAPRTASGCGAGKHEYYAIDADTLMGSGTLRAIWRAAGAAVAATDAVVAGRGRNAFCSIRPPGHHAGTSQAMGFCFVNNVAVAARRALDAHGIERVAIVDFDVHHGNGTEEIFSGDARVLMTGLFRHPYYPYSGTDHPAANMLNVPVPAGTDGKAVRAIVSEKWLPALHDFRPGMIFISAGFDAHREDDMGGLRLVEDDYAWITERIVEVADRHAAGRIVSCLEGGYSLSALGRSVVAHVRALAGL